MIRKSLDLLIRDLHEQEGWGAELGVQRKFSERIPEENIVIAACLVKAKPLDPGGLARMSLFPHPSTNVIPD
jgi:hypothetical protein